MAARQTEKKITALYERLSRDDDQLGESNSIVNQKAYLESYAAQHGFLNCAHYTDDGWSGGNFDRPDWKRLIADIEADKVATVLVKDMSRIGRDYLQTGFYTEVVFRKHHVRFIAIANGIDSNDPGTSEFAPFMNIMNEWYLRDISRKVRVAKRAKGEAGKPVASMAPYGYMKPPGEKDKWIIDEEAAEVVRRVFRMVIEGKTCWAIAKSLERDQIENPTVHFARQGRGKWKDRTTFDHPYRWKEHVIYRMLDRPEYLGHTVNFRSHTESYKDPTQVNHIGMFGFTDRDQESSAFYGYISENLSAFEATVFHEKYHYGFVKRCKRSKEKDKGIVGTCLFFTTDQSRYTGKIFGEETYLQLEHSEKKEEFCTLYGLQYRGDMLIHRMEINRDAELLRAVKQESTDEDYAFFEENIHSLDKLQKESIWRALQHDKPDEPVQNSSATFVSYNELKLRYIALKNRMPATIQQRCHHLLAECEGEGRRWSCKLVSSIDLLIS